MLFISCRDMLIIAPDKIEGQEWKQFFLRSPFGTIVLSLVLEVLASLWDIIQYFTGTPRYKYRDYYLFTPTGPIRQSNSEQ